MFVFLSTKPTCFLCSSLLFFSSSSFILAASSSDIIITGELGFSFFFFMSVLSLFLVSSFTLLVLALLSTSFLDTSLKLSSIFDTLSSSIELIWFLTSIPSFIAFSIISLLVKPNFFANSCIFILPNNFTPINYFFYLFCKIFIFNTNYCFIIFTNCLT